MSALPYELSLDSEVTASTEQVACEVDAEVVILSLRTGEYYGLDVVGATIWELVQEPRTVRSLQEALLARFDDVSADECLSHVLEFLGEMSTLRLIDVR